MARTIQQIYDSIIQEKELQPSLQSLTPVDNAQKLLSDLTTKSKVAVWRLMFWVMAVAIATLEQILDVHKTEVDTIAQNNHYGNIYWYKTKALEYQVGYPLTIQDGKVFYDTIDLEARIIKYASVTDGQIITIKVARNDSNGLPTPLYPNEKAMVTAYFNLIKPAGTFLNVISKEADKLRVYITIFYNPLLINSQGQTVTGNKPVEEAIHNYLTEMEFDGALVVSKLIDAIQAAQGVTDVQLTAIDATYYNQPNGEPVWIPIQRRYVSDAGFIRLHPDYSLSDTITYIPS
ncbi:MAG: hypothetical protein SNJ71_00180 [Bacteroidales bacterium]